MATINVISKKKSKPVTIVNSVSSSVGEQITTSTINSVSFVTEDLSKQIAPDIYYFDTTHSFIQYSLEVYVNGIRLSPGADYMENSSFNGFEMIEQNATLSKWLGPNSCILVTYIKSI